MVVKNYNHLVMCVITIALVLIIAGCGTDNDQDPQKTNNNENVEQNNQTNNEEDTSNDSTSNDDAEDEETEQETEADNSDNNAQKEAQDYSSESNPIVTLTMESGEEIEIELYPEVAPNTVANFISLVEDEFYDGLIFHRVIPGFMIQGGDPEGIGTGDPGYNIHGEFKSNGFDNDLVHERGVISMARTQDPDSAGSQFFIMVDNSPHLDGEYAGFGKVISGIEIADNIVSVDTDQEKPKKDQVIESMTVDTKGIDYDEPEIIE